MPAVGRGQTGSGEVEDEIVGGFRLFPTHLAAAAKLELEVPPVQAVPALPRVTEAFEARLAACPAEDLPYLLDQYANPIRNRAAMASHQLAAVNGTGKVT